MSILRLFAIIAIIYIIFRLMIRYLLPYIVKRFVEKQKEKFYQANPHMRKDEEETQKKHRKDGEVNIKHTTKSKKLNTDDVGEYVDFEDIE